MTTALEGGEGSASRPGRSLSPKKSRYPLYRRLGEPQGQSRQVRKILPPPGFDPRTIQPVASRYTDLAFVWSGFIPLIFRCFRKIEKKVTLSIKVFYLPTDKQEF